MNNEEENKKDNAPRSRGPQGQGAPVEKAKDAKKTFKKFTKTLGQYKISVIAMFVLSMCSAIFSIIGPKILGKATTLVAEGSFSPDGIDFDKLAEYIVLLIGLYLVSLAFATASAFIIAKVSANISYYFRNQVTDKINRTPLSYFDTHATGDTISLVTNDVDTISQSLAQSLPQVITGITTIIGVSYMMLTININMTLVVFGSLPVTMAVVIFIVKLSQKYFKGQQNALGALNGHIEESVGGIQLIQVYNNTDENIEQFEKFNSEYKLSSRKATFFSSIIFPMTYMVSNLTYAVLAMYGAVLASQGVIAVGDILSFLQYSNSFSQPIGQMSQAAAQLQSMIAAAERIYNFLETEDEDEHETKSSVDLNGIIGNVTFKGVNFGYSPEKTIINNFDAEIYSGKKIAIVGPTGAGKTTILKLLMRFYEINGGDIEIDGNNIKDFSRNDLRDLFGIVLQDTWLFSGTIMENLKLGNESATDEQVYEACKLAHIHHYILTLPDGYNSELNEESSNISQGQKQLLTIARAILSNPKILILDEATSSVDTRTEKLIQNAMYNLMGSRTSFVIAHRLSTILDADYILVMNNGDVIEQGNHKELIAQNGFYRDLYYSQFA